MLQHAEVRARVIRNFEIGSEATRFGPLEFVGGLELTSDVPDFGAISAFRFLKPGSDFMAVADTGFWVFGAVTRDAEMRPTGFENFTIQQFSDADGNPINKKWLVDAEGLAVRDGVATVGLERDHRIVQFKIAPGRMRDAFANLDFLIPRRELRMNRGFEAVTYAPKDGPLEGALVIVTERSIDKNGDVFGAVLGGPRKGIFTVKRHDPFDITDGAFLPNGDLLLLERSFSMARGVGMRLRRIPGDLIAGGAKAADGPILLEANMGYQIDNMEAMDVWQRSDGATMVSLMSDDNQSMLQRNLYLEFRLVD
ncbi:MAG: esterase-like activity of phytase family protein [Rhizobiaceae bacterium]|nr:esterase-like activity of phytase family protein [Rhizobiaceae bacterium]